MCSENESQQGKSFPLLMARKDPLPSAAGIDPRCEICPLSRVQAGVAVRIKRLCASPEVQLRLRELGFCEDHIIKLLISQSSFICQVCNARLAISEQLARVIMVEPLLPAMARA
jgi:Fe2+ transport system protein FeoA